MPDSPTARALLYFSRFALARLTALPLAALHFSPSALRERARKSVGRALATGGSGASATIRAFQWGESDGSGVSMYSPGALGACDALTEMLVLGGAEGAERFKSTARSARSAVELCVMGLALRRAWTLTAIRAGDHPAISQRLPCPVQSEALRTAPSGERLDILSRAMGAFPEWAAAVERAGQSPGLDPLDSFCHDLFHLDDCEPEPALSLLAQAYARSPGSITRALGERYVNAKNTPLESQPLSWSLLRLARDLAPALHERSALAAALDAPASPQPPAESAKRRRASL